VIGAIKNSGTVDTEKQAGGGEGMRAARQLSVRELLDVWYRRAREAQFAHYRAAKRFSGLNDALGILAALMTAGLGLQLVQVLNVGAWLNLRPETLELALGVSGLIAAALTTIQTIMRYSELAERHVRAAALYSSIRREIEAARTLSLDKIESDRTVLDSIRERLDEAAAETPDVPPVVFRRTVEELERQSGPGPHLI
jgi:hypothetical protein